LIDAVHRPDFTRKSHLAAQTGVALYRNIETRREHCTDYGQIQSGIVHFQASGDIQKHIFLSQLKSGAFFENGQQHVHPSDIESRCRSLRSSISGRAHKRLRFDEKRTNALNGGSNGYAT
jgi:hypothetical protein